MAMTGRMLSRISRSGFFQPWQNTGSDDMPKGRGCNRKWQAKEDWIRAVALLRLWGCDNGVSNVSLLVQQWGVLGGSEGVKQYVNYSNYGSLIDNRNDG